MKIVVTILGVVAVLALITASVAMGRVNHLEQMVEETNAQVCVDSEQAMKSVADSFKLNRLDYSLSWTTPSGTHILAGAFK